MYLLIIILFLYISSLTNTVYGGDGGDLLGAILTKGFAHPPGYSFYTILGIIFNYLPLWFMTPAGKVTLISTFSTFFSCILLYLIIKEITEKKFNKYLALIVTFLFSVNYVVWLYASVPEVFPLNTFLIAMIFYLTLKITKKAKSLYVYLLFFSIGLAFTHHLTFIIVLPSILFIFFKFRNKIKINKKKVIISVSCFFAGLFPLLYLWTAYQLKRELIWGPVNNIADLVNIVSRKGYGTFSAGSFVMQIPEQRLIQIENVFNQIIIDFSVVGIVIFLFGLWYLYREQNKSVKVYVYAILINIILFGPFFFFYANFPLIEKFFIATAERFLHSFYFFFCIWLYFGIVQIWLLTQKFIIQKYILNRSLKKILPTLLLITLTLYPLSIFIKNAPSVYSLHNDKTAENLGKDIMQNADKHSLILLSEDTALFNTQYVYYSNKSQYKDKIIVHASKLLFDFYVRILKYHYPDITIPDLKRSKAPIEDFINLNKDKFTIYANEIHPLPRLKNLVWVNQGILYKLEKKDTINIQGNTTKLIQFWNNSYNKNLVDQIIHNPVKFTNYFTYDIPRTYAFAHQNTAYYFLNIGDLDKAYYHIQQSMILKDDEPDNYYLLSIMYKEKNDCPKSEEEIIKAINTSKDSLYINQLESLTQCYKDTNNKNRIKKLIDDYKNNKNVPLNKF